MLLTKEVEVNLTSMNIIYYEKIGYEIHRSKDKKGRFTVPRGTKLKIKVEDLSEGSHVSVNVKCDCPDCKDPYLKPIKWQDYLKCVKEDSKYYCRICAKILYGAEKNRLSRLSNGKSFEQWCIENNQEDVLKRWDYELNKNIKPSEVSYSSEGFNKIGYWFKCPKGKHKSELKNIGSFVAGHYKTINCKECNSFAQYIIDKYGENGLDLYWNWELNNRLKLNPWKISKSKHIKAWINCAENNEHESYFIEINKFTSNGYRCPLCNISKGERMIKDYLVKNNIQYIYQYKYDDLKGVGNRNLSYDFYLPKPNLLVEYQGQYHDGTSDNQTDEEFIIQQEHDKRKREYARNHNIKFLSIWYWDMGNIEDILSKELNIINQKEVS